MIPRKLRGLAVRSSEAGRWQSTATPTRTTIYRSGKIRFIDAFGCFTRAFRTRRLG